MIKALIFSGLAIFWVSQVIAQPLGSGTYTSPYSEGGADGPVLIQIGNPVDIYPTNIPKKLYWIGVALFNSSAQYTPIPLHGYRISDLNKDNKNIAIKALLEAAAGNIHMAMLLPNGNGGAYQAWSIQVNKDNNSQNETDMSAAWDQFQITHNISDNALMALTRPLRSGLATKQDEFIVLPNFWQ